MSIEELVGRFSVCEDHYDLDDGAQSARRLLLTREEWVAREKLGGASGSSSGGGGGGKNRSPAKAKSQGGGKGAGERGRRWLRRLGRQEKKGEVPPLWDPRALEKGVPHLAP